MRKPVAIHYRTGTGPYAQDAPTFVLTGWRSTHMYNCALDEWFRVSNRAPPEAHVHWRPGMGIYPIPFRLLVRQVGWWRAALEVFEVACGVRTVGRILDWRRPVPEDMADFEPPRIRGE